MLFILTSGDRRLGCLHLLTTVKNAALNIHVQAFIWTSVFNMLGYLPGVGFLGPVAILRLISWENDIVLCLSSLENFHRFLPSIKAPWWRTEKSSVQRTKEAPFKILGKKQPFYGWLKVYQRQAQYWAFYATFPSFQGLGHRSKLLPQPGAWEGALARATPLQQGVGGGPCG